MHESSPQQFDPQNPSAELLVNAYSQGVFPMADLEEDCINWYCPDPRAVIPLEAFHVPKSLGRVVRKGEFEIRSDCDFEAVIRACAEPREGSWISERLIKAYLELHQQGRAHSVEAYKDNQLVGGLYGVHLGSAFCGESMFSLPEQGGTNASKVCLVHLVNWLRKRGFTLLDSQFVNPHLMQFGCVEIPRAEYLRRLLAAVNQPVVWGDFRPHCQEEA